MYHNAHDASTVPWVIGLIILVCCVFMAYAKDWGTHEQYYNPDHVPNKSIGVLFGGVALCAFVGWVFSQIVRTI